MSRVLAAPALVQIPSDRAARSAPLCFAAALAAVAAACGTGAGGVDACKAIEEARCRQAPHCSNVQISPPLYYTSGTDVDACIRYYDTACGHGLANGDPGSAKVNACVAAIAANGCSVVAAPESDPACSWLAPPDAGEEAGEDASDATPDGDASGDAGGSG
jgi:hypothetical protein